MSTDAVDNALEIQPRRVSFLGALTSAADDDPTLAPASRREVLVLFALPVAALVLILVVAVSAEIAGDVPDWVTATVLALSITLGLLGVLLSIRVYFHREAYIAAGQSMLGSLRQTHSAALVAMTASPFAAERFSRMLRIARMIAQGLRLSRDDDLAGELEEQVRELLWELNESIAHSPTSDPLV